MRWHLALAALAACSDGNKQPLDAPADVFFTGEVVDWDSTDASFCGVFMATMTVHGDPSRTSSTNPNGRFQLNVPGGVTTVQVDLTPSTAASQCLSGTQTYATPGLVVANEAVIAALATKMGVYSARMMTTTRQASFYSSFGSAFDASKAQLFVHEDGGIPRALAISASAGSPQAWSGTAWSAGDTGIDVLFPNVDASNATTSLTMTGNAIGTGTVPLSAGTVSYVTVVPN